MFGAASLTKNGDIDQDRYSGCGIGFDRKIEFSFGSRGSGRNCIIFGADMSSSSHTNKKANNILVLGKDFVQGINGTTIYAKKSIRLILLKIIKSSVCYCITAMEQTSLIYSLMTKRFINSPQKFQKTFQ